MTGGARLERIDQLRGLAALAVVVCHAAVSAYDGVPNLHGEPWPWLRLVLGFGYLGVPLFFVISGFCIHLPQARLLAATPARRPAWRRFFARRFWRLYPPYLAALAVSLGLWSLAKGLPAVPWHVLPAQALLAHTFHTTTFDGVNPPAWTLAVEWQFYLTYPLVFWLIARRGALRALAYVLGVTMAYRLVLNFDPFPAGFGGPAWEFFLARWFEWVLGAVIAEWTAGRLALPRVVFQPWLAAIALGLAVALEWHTWRYGVYTLKEPLYGIAFALVLCVALDRRHAGAASLVGRYLAGVGLYSYSLYLLHRPIQLAVEPLVRQVTTWPAIITHGIPSSLFLMMATIPIALWASRLFYRVCEGPCAARAQRMGSPRREAGSAPGGAAGRQENAPLPDARPAISAAAVPARE